MANEHDVQRLLMKRAFAKFVINFMLKAHNNQLHREGVTGPVQKKQRRDKILTRHIAWAARP